MFTNFAVCLTKSKSDTAFPFFLRTLEHFHWGFFAIRRSHTEKTLRIRARSLCIWCPAWFSSGACRNTSRNRGLLLWKLQTTEVKEGLKAGSHWCFSKIPPTSAMRSSTLGCREMVQYEESMLLLRGCEFSSLHPRQAVLSHLTPAPEDLMPLAFGPLHSSAHTYVNAPH